MAFRDAVTGIEQMNPDNVESVGRECMDAKGVIKSVLPSLMGIPAKMNWDSDARELADRRLAELVELAEALYCALDKAGPAIVDYADAQRRARAHVREGIAAEERLKALIAPIAATQSRVVQESDALRQWNDLREVTGALDYLAEAGLRQAIERVRGRAESLWYQATQAYDLAIRVEHDARAAAADQLGAARLLLPDLPGNPALAGIFADDPSTSDGHAYHIGPPVAPPILQDSTFQYDPNALPTTEDKKSYLDWSAKMGAARPLLPDASLAYAHYLEGTGTDMRIDYEKAYAEDSGIKRVVDAEILSAQREAERLYAETGQSAFQMTGRATRASDLVGEPNPAHGENWQKALGGHVVYGTSDVVVQGDRITMKITVHAEDMYNFNPGGTDIARGIPNEVNGRFSTFGWAKEFRSYGDLERTITWTIGEVPRA